ncbi:ribosomal RNA small subunit methyltransferase A [Candidatus Saccharibacteria bacterium]|nr:ribosomal RNA small subunit methyltransferase A [Candidatus Saccharibacteria bacterium]
MKNKKELGQNWLNNREILNTIARLAAYGTSDINTSGVEAEKMGLCVEIGPGLGTLTSSLLRVFERVVAVEYDESLARNLPGSFPGKNLTVVNDDILQYDFPSSDNYVVAGNIPYYITSPIIEKILTLKNPPVRIVLLIQKEVAERIVDRRESVLSLFVKNHARAVLGPVVSRDEFTPPPKVDSQVIVLTPHPAVIPDEVFRLIKIGFTNPRKKLIHNLSCVKSKEEWTIIFNRLSISPDARAADIPLAIWQELYKTSLA